MEPEPRCLSALQRALTEAFGLPRRYLEFASWKTGPSSRAHIHCDADRCAVWVSTIGGRSPRLLVTVRQSDAIPGAIGALRQFAREAARD